MPKDQDNQMELAFENGRKAEEQQPGKARARKRRGAPKSASSEKCDGDVQGPAANDRNGWRIWSVMTGRECIGVRARSPEEACRMVESRGITPRSVLLPPAELEHCVDRMLEV